MGGGIDSWMDGWTKKQLFPHHISGRGMGGQTDVWMDGYERNNFFPLNIISFIYVKNI